MQVLALALNCFLCNGPLAAVDPRGFGEWKFSMERGRGTLSPGPLVDVSYDLDKCQKKECSEYVMSRYAKPHYFGALIPGRWREDNGKGEGQILAKLGL